jgi:Tol biopolymer transport system component
VSPDGKWILFSASGPGDNLYVIGADGSNYRQITSGNSLNRGGRWHTDGSRIFFYSNRSGSYQAWQVGFDGSGLQQLTNITGSVVLPIVSPRFDRFAFASTTISGRDEVHVASFAALQAALKADSREPRAIPIVSVLSHLTPSPPKGFLIPSSWSPDGTLLAEFLAPPDEGLFIYSPQNDRHDDLRVAGQDPRWLPDGRHLVFHDSARVFWLDVVNGRSRAVYQLPSRSQIPNFGFALSFDGRHIVLVASEEPSDVWLMNFN